MANGDINCFEPPRGGLRGGGVYRFWGYGGISPHQEFLNETDAF